MVLKATFFSGLLSIFSSCLAQDHNKPQSLVVPATGDTVSYMGYDKQCMFQSRYVFQDAKNNMWFATNGDGIYKYDDKTMLMFTAKQGLADDFVWNMQEDKDGALWFKTRDGISRYDGAAFTTYSNKELAKLSAAPAKEWQKSPADLWFDVSGRNGVYRYSGGSFTYLLLPKADVDTVTVQQPSVNYSPYAVYCMLTDSKGNLWFGTQSMGVCRYDGRSFSWFTQSGLRDNAVRSVFEDRHGTIWIGNNGGGLFSYDGKTLRGFLNESKVRKNAAIKYPTAKDSALARVWSITDDAAGNLWIATIDEGVWKFDGTTMTNYTTDNGLGLDFIWTINKDKKGNLWFGTDGAGVYRFDGKRFKRFVL